MARARAQREAERPPFPLTTAEREYAASLIRRAVIHAGVALDVANRHRLNGPAERIEWALVFLEDAAEEAARWR